MRSIYHCLPAVIVLFLCSAATYAQDPLSPAELPRFQQVNEKLYRGGQPLAGGILRLRELGFDTVVNLRGTSDRTRADAAEARALGMSYFNVALPNWGRPQDERVRRILLIVAAPQNGRVFVHCRDGVDRTGMIVALHRITHEGWNTTDALAEAERLGMRRIQFWMRDYAEDYGSVGQDFSDRLGASMRIMEWGAFRARKMGGRVLRRLF